MLTIKLVKLTGSGCHDKRADPEGTDERARIGVGKVLKRRGRALRAPKASTRIGNAVHPLQSTIGSPGSAVSCPSGSGGARIFRLWGHNHSTRI